MDLQVLQKYRRTTCPSDDRLYDPFKREFDGMQHGCPPLIFMLKLYRNTAGHVNTCNKKYDNLSYMINIQTN